MGGVHSSINQCKEEYNDMAKAIKVLQHENNKLKLEKEKLNTNIYGLLQDIKSEKIKRIYIEKNIASLLDSSICDKYMMTEHNNIIVSDEEINKKLLHQFIVYVKKEWNDIFKEYHKPS